jgi:hypothetical protein
MTKTAKKNRAPSNGTNDLGAATPRKGDVLWRTGVWSPGVDDGAPSIFVQKVVVESWGKKQATLRVVATGEMIGFHVTPALAGSPLAWTREGLAPAIEAAKGKIAAEFAHCSDIRRDWLAAYGFSAAASVVAAARARLALLAAGPGEIATIEL